MKQYIIIIFFALCVVSCNSRSMQKETLSQKETFINEKPDSALSILQQLNIDDNYARMLTCYAQGKLQCENEDYPASIISFFNAEKMAKELNNPFLLGLIYHSVSNIYGQVQNHIEQQNYAQMAYDNFVLSGKTDYINLGLEALANANYYNMNYDNSASLALQLLDNAQNDSLVKTKGLRLLGNAYIKSANYEKAKTTFLALKSIADTLTRQDYRNICMAYIKTGELDSANIYRKFAETDNRRSLWIVIKDPDTGKPIANILDLEENTASADTVTQKIISQNLAQTVANYHAYEQTLHEAELKSERLSKISIVVIALLVISFLIVWYHLHEKAHRKEMEMKILEAENLRHILNVTQQENTSAMQEAVNRLFEQKFKTIDQLCNTYYVYQGSNNERTKIYNNVIDLISNLSKDKKTISELEAFVNTYKNNLMADFRAEYPTLKDEDYLLFLYIVVNFSSRAISILIGESLSVVYNRKSSLKRKIQQGDSIHKDLFIAEFS